MVHINKEKRLFTIEFMGDDSDYMRYCRAIVCLIAAHDSDLIDTNSLRDAASLLDAMLPTERQNIKVE